MRNLWLAILFLVGACGGSVTSSNPTVTLSTELGDIVIEMAVEAAPLTATNFIQLVEGGYLDSGSFYRVVYPENDNGAPPISVIQGGLQDAMGRFPKIPHESTEQTGLRHLDGSISMARGEVGTASTEFFICVGDQPALDHGAIRNSDGQGFAVFGRVVKGMDVVREIQRQDARAPVEEDYVAGQILVEPVEITSARLQP